MIVRRGLLIYLLIQSFLFCSGCSNDKSSGTPTANCTAVTDSLRTPKSIADTIALVNALPKPLTIDC